jgi:penicillin amidase
MKPVIRLMRGFVALSLGLVLTGAVAVGVVIWTTLPGGDLSQTIPGLQAPVSITIDQDGIPRVSAGNERDGAAALGFLHARERLFEMDLMRRAARGELSAMAGPATLRLDRLSRTLDLRRHAEADLAGLSPQTRAVLAAYASGVNAWIDRRGRFSGLEFVLLGTPRHWTEVDCLLWGKTMGLYLSGNWRTELARLGLSGRMTPAQIAALWPSQTALPASAANLAWPLHLLTENLPHFPEPFTLPASASNAWALDGTHTESGAPLLAGDPHLAFGLPAIWYLARIDLPDRSMVGATAPGVPFLVIGHNGWIAWSFTTTGADVQDLFIETPDAGGVMTPRGHEDFTTRQEIIQIRGMADEVLTVRETRHGPVVSDLLGDGASVITLSMANLADGDTAADGLLALNRARSVAEAGRTASAITSPVQNLMVADRDGIGFFVTGRVPIRKSGDGATPAPGQDGSHDWIGWASGDQLPHHVSPPSGRFVNANERVAPPDFPVFLGADWFGDTRARRIRAMLDATPRATIGDFTRMQVDDLDLVAAEMFPHLVALMPDLAAWDGRMRADLPAPLIFNAWMIAFNQAILRAQGVADRDTPATAPWPDLVRAALRDGSTLCNGACEPLLRDSLALAMRQLETRFGADRSKWRWGDAHQAVFASPVLRMLPVLGWLSEARIEMSGSDSTVGRGGMRQDNFESVHGAAFRGVYDLSDLERSRFMVAPGQSGHPASSLARNFLRQWRDGATISIGSRPNDVAVRIGLSP